MYTVGWLKSDLKGAQARLEDARRQGIDLTELLPLLVALVELAREIVPDLLKPKHGLEDAIEEAARDLPPDWMISIAVGPGSAVVELDHIGDEDETPPSVDGTLAEQVREMTKVAVYRQKLLDRLP